MKKLIAIVLVLVMMLSLATVAFAAGETTGKHDALEGLGKLAWGIYQKNFCQHKWIAKGWMDKNEAAYTHTEKYVCALCGDVKYEEHDCTPYDMQSFINNGMTIHHECAVCGNCWDEKIVGHIHHFEATGYYEPTTFNGIPMHCQIYACECGYTKNGIPTLCLPLTDDTGDVDYAHNLCCAVCGRSFLSVPTAEKVVNDIVATVKYRAQAVIAEQINNVLTTLYNNLTAEQRNVVDTVRKVSAYVKEVWTDYYWRDLRSDQEFLANKVAATTEDVDLSSFTFGVEEVGNNVLVTVRNQTDAGEVICVMTFKYICNTLLYETADYYVPDNATAKALAAELKKDSTVIPCSVKVNGNCVSCRMKCSEISELRELTRAELVEAMQYAIDATK